MTLPAEALAAAEEMLAEIGDPMTLGTSKVVADHWIETHTLGCRNHADEPEAEWWESHWAIHYDYSTDGISHVLGDPADGKFVTITPQRSA